MMNLIKSSFRITKAVILSVILICLIIFMVNNRDIITINFFPLPFGVETRVFFLMLICFLLGMICGLILFSQSMIKNMVNNWRNKRRSNDHIG